MPKHAGRKTRNTARNKGKPYAKADVSNNVEEATNQASDCEEEPAICPICDTAIQENAAEDTQSSGDEAVFCEGKCEAWFHRKCAGLSKTAFIMASESEMSLLLYVLFASCTCE